MKLYVTPNSPYARMARIMVLEKGLENRTEILVARTRTPDSGYYQVNPSGRVPYLIDDGGAGWEESTLICAYLDRLDGAPVFEPPPGKQGWQARRLEASAQSLLGGLAVWVRELYRPENERSPSVIEHERLRSRRLTGLWEQQIDHPLMKGPLNMAQITLICALQLEISTPDIQWRPNRPKLSHWSDQIAQRPSVAATLPIARR